MPRKISLKSEMLNLDEGYLLRRSFIGVVSQYELHLYGKPFSLFSGVFMGVFLRFGWKKEDRWKRGKEMCVADGGEEGT